MLEDIVIGPFRFRIDFLLIPIGVGIATQLPLGVGLLLALLVHELGHAIAARLVTRSPFVMFLQVGGGGSYVRNVTGNRAKAVVLLAGPALTLVLALAGHLVVRLAPTTEMAWWGASVRFTALMWTAFQMSPFPTMDVGLLIRGWILARTESATLAWRVGWTLGFAFVVMIVTLQFELLPWAAWLTLMALLMGRAQAAYVRHVDAFAAWERGNHKGVLEIVDKLPERTHRDDAIPILELGLASALELEDFGSVETISGRLPVYHSATLGAGEWLLRRDRPYGAKIAERALDALDAERVKQADVDLERYADLTFRFAIHEATQLRLESALGLLERAAIFGFDDVDRLEAEGRFEPIRGRPRYMAVIARLKA